jgi:hypothetical protein
MKKIKLDSPEETSPTNQPMTYQTGTCVKRNNKTICQTIISAILISPGTKSGIHALTMDWLRGTCQMDGPEIGTRQVNFKILAVSGITFQKE